MRQSRFQEGIEKNVDFRDPFFPILADFGCPRGVSKMFFGCFFASFSLLGANFVDRAPFWAILMDFGGLGAVFG